MRVLFGSGNGTYSSESLVLIGPNPRSHLPILQNCASDKLRKVGLTSKGEHCNILHTKDMLNLWFLGLLEGGYSITCAILTYLSLRYVLIRYADA